QWPGGAETTGVVYVTLAFRRPALVALDEQADGVAGQAHAGGVEERLAGHDVLGLAHEGADDPRGGAGTAGGARAGEGERGAHEGEEAAARDGVGPLAGAGGELALDHLGDGGLVGELLEAAPVLLALGGGEAVAQEVGVGRGSLHGGLSGGGR